MSVSVACPNGPSGQVAVRVCKTTGEWGNVESGMCAQAEETTRLLSEISQVHLISTSKYVISVEVSI